MLRAVIELMMYDKLWLSLTVKMMHESLYIILAVKKMSDEK